MTSLLKLDLLKYAIVSEDGQRALASKDTRYYTVKTTCIEQALLFSTKEIADNQLEWIVIKDERAGAGFAQGSRVVKVIQSFKVNEIEV